MRHILFIFCWLLPIITQAESGQRPNVLLILADDLGFSDIGCYGGEIQTPNLDRLADEGLRFTQFYNTARCWPTRAAILTGFYAQQIGRDVLPGVPGNGHGTRPDWAPLLPRLLHPLGYRSFHSGKWHIDGEPLDEGFDRAYELRDLGRLFSPGRHFLDGQKLAPVSVDDNFYVTDFIADQTVQFLKDHHRDDGGKPFFSFVAFTAPHFPLQAPQSDIAKYGGRYDAGWDRLRQERFDRIQSMFDLPASLAPLEPEIGPPYHFENVRQTFGDKEVDRELPWSDLTTDQKRFQSMKMEIHAAMVDRMDQAIGRILDQVDVMDATENTMVIFLSDNGASAELMVRGDGHDSTAPPGSAATHLCLGPGFSSAANTPFRRHKTWVHEGGIATPLVVRWPAKIGAAQIRGQVGHVIDLVPTIYQAAGGKELPNDRPGKSLLATMTRDAQTTRQYLWWLHDGHRAIRVGDFKAVSASGHPWELYDLSVDRSECHDLATEQPDRLEQMIQLWQQHADQSRPAP